MMHQDKNILKLYRYAWQPARYAHPLWLERIGMFNSSSWRYGQNKPLDTRLDQALIMQRGFPRAPLPGHLTPRQQHLLQLAPQLMTLALSQGLMSLACGDYFLLPDYRAVINPWIDDPLAWQLYGFSGSARSPRLAPEQLLPVAQSIGIATLHRAAVVDVVWQALLILLPPPTQALWPRLSPQTLPFLETLLWRYFYACNEPTDPPDH